MPMTPQPLLDFDAAPVPFAAGSHTSFVSALQVAHSGTRGRKTRAYLRRLQVAGEDGLTDPEAARAVALALALPKGIPVQSICSIRGACRTALLVTRAGIVEGDWGKPNHRWRLTAAGIAATRQLSEGI